MRKFSLRQIELWVVLLAVTLSGSQCGNPTEPQPVVDAEYPIYFYNRSGDQLLFEYHPTTQTMDSTIIQWDPDKITISADGKLLYLVLHQSIVVINAKSYEFVRELPYVTLSAVAVSNDNKLIAITGDTLRILRTSDYEIIYSDTTSETYRGIFSHDNSTFYCGILDSVNSGAVYKLELASPNFIKTTKSFENTGVRSIKPTHDETKWIIYSGLRYYIYDVAQDTFIFEGYLRAGWGSTALSADGKKVYITDPGPAGSLDWLDPAIIVFDIESNSIETIIDSILLFSDDSTWVTNPNDVVITPDNKYLGVLGGATFLNVFLLFDLQTLEMIDKIKYYSNQYVLTPMTVQNVQ